MRSLKPVRQKEAISKMKNFNTEPLRNRVAQSIDFQFYFLCVTSYLCISVLKIIFLPTESHQPALWVAYII